MLLYVLNLEERQFASFVLFIWKNDSGIWLKCPIRR